MDLLWLPFSLATILMYGLGQVFAKETRSEISSGNLLLILGANIVMMWGIYWLIFRDPGSHSWWVWTKAAITVALSGLAFITYYESLKRGKISIVGTIAGAYAPWTVILALVFLGESLSLGEGVGVAMIVTSMLLFTHTAGENGRRRTELLGIVFAACSLFLWGTSAAMAKDVITDIGNTAFIGIYALVCPSIWVVFWVITARGRFQLPEVSPRLLELSVLFLAGGGITFYLAIENGPVSIVSPVTNLYPIVTIAFAKIRLKERLSYLQMAALAMLLLSIPLFSL